MTTREQLTAIVARFLWWSGMKTTSPSPPHHLLEALERHHASGLVDYVTLYVAHPDARTFGPKVTALASA